MGSSNLFSFTKIENKTDVLKYAIELTSEKGKPNYVEAKKLYRFFISLVDVLDVKNTWDEVNKAINAFKEMPKN